MHHKIVWPSDPFGKATAVICADGESEGQGTRDDFLILYVHVPRDKQNPTYKSQNEYNAFNDHGQSYLSPSKSPFPK